MLFGECKHRDTLPEETRRLAMQALGAMVDAHVLLAEAKRWEITESNPGILRADFEAVLSRVKAAERSLDELLDTED